MLLFLFSSEISKLNLVVTNFIFIMLLVHGKYSQFGIFQGFIIKKN